MILSVSRRTDIPAFYTEWFFKRLKEGFVFVRNPLNYHQVGKIILDPSVIDCIVFWTKDPSVMLEKLDLLSEYRYYFLITINGYDKEIERNTPSQKSVIEAFKSLSDKIGRQKTIWRYDPIILTVKMDIGYHCENFEKISSELKGYTNNCIISFVVNYKKTARNMKNAGEILTDNSKMTEIGSRFSKIAQKYDIIIKTCCEQLDMSCFGIEHSKCIDDRLISKITGKEINVKKDKSQRDICGCVASIDIGAYDSCGHGCRYCYANSSEISVKNSLLKHNPDSPFLIGNIEPEDKITDRKMESYIGN